MHEFIDIASMILTKSIEDKNLQMQQLNKIQESVAISMIRILINFSSKITSKDPIFMYKSNIGVFKIEYIKITKMMKEMYYLDSEKNYSLKIPSNLFENTLYDKRIISMKLLSIVWLISPLNLTSNNHIFMLSEVISVYLLTKFREIIDLPNNKIIAYIPYSKRISDNLTNSWKSWKIEISNSMISEEKWKIIHQKTSDLLFKNWISWENKTIALIESPLSSSFAIITSPNKGIYFSIF